MKTVALLLAATLSVSAWAQAPSDPGGAEVAARDRALNALLLERKATDAQAFYDDQFLLTTGTGRTKTKQDILAEVQSPKVVMEVNETTDVQVRVRDNTAVLTGVLHQRGTYEGKAFDVKLHVTDTWVRSGGSWRLLAGHASLV